MMALSSPPGRDPSSDADVGVDRATRQGIRQRDPEALGRLYDAAFPYVYNLAHRLTGNREAAEDITQDVFIKVYGAALRLDPERPLKPWLTTITYNAFRDSLRRSAARPERQAGPDELAARHSTHDTPEVELLRKEQVQLLEAALARLDEPSRTVVILHDYCGRSHDEIAETIGASHAAVRKRHSRALKRLAELIEDRQG